VALLLTTLAGCEPAPRSQSYFAGHADVRAGVLAGCATGARRGGECVTAQAAEAAAKAQARQDYYRKGF
jgi:hypothetical protein